MSGPRGVGGFEEGEFEGDSPTEEVAAQVRLCWSNPVQFCAQEIDEVAKTRIVVQRDPLDIRRRMEVVALLEPAGEGVAIDPGFRLEGRSTILLSGRRIQQEGDGAWRSRS